MGGDSGEVPPINPHAFGLQWIQAWNSRSIESILSHYSESIEFISPRVAARHAETGVGDPTGKLVGKAALRAYFQEALDKLSNLKLDLQDVLVGVDGCCLVYTRETGAKVAEMFKLDAEGKAVSVQVFYDLVC